MPRMIEVVPYDPNWVRKYEVEAKKLVEVFGDDLMEIHHIGSTAITGMHAKPTIDVLIVVKDIEAVETLNRVMREMGYKPKGENGIPGRRYFQKLAGEVHQFHVHTYEDGHPEIHRLLNFRDFLRTHSEEARAYQALKLDLASKYTFEPNKYTDGKHTLIGEIDQRAAAWRALEREDTSNAE